MHGLLQGLFCQPACDTGQSSKAPKLTFRCWQRSLLEKPGLGGFDEVCMGAQPQHVRGIKTLQQLLARHSLVLPISLSGARYQIMLSTRRAAAVCSRTSPPHRWRIAGLRWFLFSTAH